MALTEATKEVLFLQKLCKTFWMTQDDNNTIFTNNIGAVALTKEHSHSHQRTKHIDIKYHFVREHTCVIYTNISAESRIQQIHILTKPLPQLLHQTGLILIAMLPRSHNWRDILRGNRVILLPSTKLTIPYFEVIYSYFLFYIKSGIFYTDILLVKRRFLTISGLLLTILRKVVFSWAWSRIFWNKFGATLLLSLFTKSILLIYQMRFKSVGIISICNMWLNNRFLTNKLRGRYQLFWKFVERHFGKGLSGRWPTS